MQVAHEPAHEQMSVAGGKRSSPVGCKEFQALVLQTLHVLHLEVAHAVVDGQSGEVRPGQVDGPRGVVVLHQPASPWKRVQVELLRDEFQLFGPRKAVGLL